MTDLTLRLFQPGDAVAFHDLNRDWIEQYFEMEAKDRAMLEDPQTHILDKGGAIIIAASTGHVVGTVALIPMSDGRVELAKMAVASSERGAGIGQALIDKASTVAKDMHMREIWLESNTVLEPAIRLYERTGFRRLTDAEIAASPYARCNIQMVKAL